ncbi:C6 transcription factor [Trichophyton tonsurans CBS 112818]|uniref:C6 transcription factor n=1 Tax=Trichophyton tonsurans (strain CBS 112818) TaxID=647933 RepID=F2RXQ8_TRIT1|nr:C6 transcription factor [Trichophyton tonsurans CBS 112818]
MSPTPPTTSPSTHSPEGQYRVVRKRNRVPVSCAPCRNRKLKCNRATPCENCVKRDDIASCSYAQSTNRRRRQNTQSAMSSPDDMQNRIDRLENLVLSLMTNGAQSAGPTAAIATVSGDGSIDSQGPQSASTNTVDIDLKDEESDTEQVTKSFGVMKVDNQSQKSYYVSGAHWSTILNDISEVKHFWATHKKQYEEQVQKVQATKQTQDLKGSALIFGAMSLPTEAEIMASFPSRYTADMLLRRFFATLDPSTTLVHGPTFWKEYEAHWQDPSKTSMVWIAMVFAMLRLAMLSYHRERDEPPEFRGKSLDIAKTYRIAMAQGLVYSDFTKPHRYLLETLAFHLQAEYSQSCDSETSVWILVGMIVRLGMRMGYHRDSKMFPNISVFQGEMRRRLWTWVRQADLLFSFEAGLPSMIRTGDSDTDFPRCLYDEDFDEDSKETPPERPFNQPAPIAYTIAHARLTTVFGRVLEQSQKLRGSSYEEVLELDRELRHAREVIPEWLQMKPLPECSHEPSTLIMNRIAVESIYHKAQCVLHRPYLTRARENPRYTLSHRACIDSSLELLRLQAMIHAEKTSGRRVLHPRYYIISLTGHDFLLASTILALDLYHEAQLEANRRQGESPYGWGCGMQEEMLATLRQSYNIWNELKDESMDAWKASSVLGLLLEKISCRRENRDTTSMDSSFDPQDEKQSAAMTLGLLSSGLTPQGPTSPPQFGDSMIGIDRTSSAQQGSLPSNMDQLAGLNSPFGMFGQMPDMQPFNLDWEAWDNYIQSAALDPTNQNWTDVNQRQDFQQIHQPQTTAENEPNMSIRPPTYPLRNGTYDVNGNTSTHPTYMDNNDYQGGENAS